MRTPERASFLAYLICWWPKRATAEAMLREWHEIWERKVLRRDDTLALADLARICNAGDTTLDGNPAIMGANEGRRQVWLHICTALRIDETETQQLLEKTE